MQERAQQCACQLLSGGRGLWPQATALDAAIVSYYEVDKGGDSKILLFVMAVLNRGEKLVQTPRVEGGA